MTAPAVSYLEIKLDDRTVVGQPRPEDQGRLIGLAAAGALTLSIEPSKLDTEGHGLSTDVAVDVEGHALTLRLPNATDATALRRALAVGALTATVAFGAVAAASMHQPSDVVAPPAPVAPAAPAAAPARDLATLREDRLAAIENTAGSTGEVSGTTSEAPPETRDTRSGPLEFDR